MNYDKNKLLLRMNLSGCKYSRVLEKETKVFLENDAIVIARGSRGPGPNAATSYCGGTLAGAGS